MWLFLIGMAFILGAVAVGLEIALALVFFLIVFGFFAKLLFLFFAALSGWWPIVLVLGIGTLIFGPELLGGLFAVVMVASAFLAVIFVFLHCLGIVDGRRDNY